MTAPQTVFTPVGRKQADPEPIPAEPIPAGPVTQPEFDHRAYGLALTPLGDEGVIIAEGHVPARRFIAACNHMARTAMSLTGLIDGIEFESMGDIYGEVAHRWVLPIPNPHGEPEWYVRYDSRVTADTPGAVAVTMWGPWW